MKNLSSTAAFLIYSLLLGAGFVFAAYKQTAPYLTFASNFTIAFGAYIGKRLVQKKSAYAQENTDVGHD